MNKIATKLTLSILKTIGIWFFLLAPANAGTIFLEPIITKPNLNFPDGAVLPPEFLPNTTASWYAPDSSGEQNFVNNTGFNMTIFKLVIVDQQYNGDDVSWGDANGDGKIGQSDVFSSFTINPNNSRPQLDITGGIIPNGNSFVFQFISNPDIREEGFRVNGPILIAGIYDGVVPTPVFESSQTWGLMLLMAGYFSKKVRNAKLKS